jgi:tetratricopeptide (TPR) repeat protein
MSMTLYDGLVIVNMSLPDNTYTTVSYNILEGYIAKMFNRSIVMNKKGEHDAAIAHINKALELNSEYSCAYAFRGDAYYMERQKLQAIDDLKNALQLLPDNQWAKDKLKKILG